MAKQSPADYTIKNKQTICFVKKRVANATRPFYVSQSPGTVPHKKYGLIKIILSPYG
jgi:hypothetical protein